MRGSVFYTMGVGDLFIVLCIFTVFVCSCSGQNIHLSCNRTTAPSVDPSPPDLVQIVKFFESQAITPGLLRDAVLTELLTIKYVLEFKGGAHSEDVNMFVTDLIKKYGFPVEVHEVQTEDGYLLTLYRIPGPGSPVLLHHGLLSSGDDFVTAGPVSAMAYYLSRRKYDVWITNARGNKHSRKHATMSPECAEYWDFSWDEIGRYDLPAAIDHVLNATGYKQLAYIGHSLGNTVFYVLASERPEYNEKISIMIAMCPVAWMKHHRSPPLRLLALDNDLSYTFLTAIGLDEFISDNVFIRALKSIFCGNNSLANLICSNVIYFFFGFDLAQQNVTQLPVEFQHTLAGASTKQVIHYSQLIQSERFCQFDYPDKAKNVEKYGSESPPDYPLEKVTAPVALFYSNVDWIADVRDVEKLRDALPNVVNYYLLDHYWHFDYIWATNVNQLVNPQIIELIEKYPPQK